MGRGSTGDLLFVLEQVASFEKPPESSFAKEQGVGAICSLGGLNKVVKTKHKLSTQKRAHYDSYNLAIAGPLFSVSKRLIGH